MTIELAEAEQRQIDVQLTPVGLGELALQRFFIVTMPQAGVAYYQVHCDVYNPSSYPASGSVHITGRLWTNEPLANFEVDEIFEFTVNPKKSHKCYFNWRKYNYIPEGAACWFDVETSWGETMPRTYWTAGWYAYETAIAVDQITASSALLRYCSRSANNIFDWVVWSPPTWPDHVIYEDCEVSEDDYYKGYTSCYWHVLALLPNREYKAEGSGNHMDYADLIFNTP